MDTDNRFFHYPHEIRSHVRNISLPSYLIADWMEHLPTTGWSPGGGPDIKSWPIPLATYSLNIKNLDWFKKETDKENSFALHRFIWLLRWLSLHPAVKYLESSDSIILDWIRQVGLHTNPTAWETYSTSERVVNWLLYLGATKAHRRFEKSASQNIGVSLLEHLDHILRHLEYYGRSCHNHILNNARALYIGGQVLHLPQVAALARYLFRLHLPKLVDEQGALLESSSHYQLLLTRTMVEVLQTTRICGDSDFEKYVGGVVTSMRSCCQYISGPGGQNIAKDFPRVGDISPDCPVAWFYPDCQCRDKAESWWGLWDSEAISIPLDKPNQDHDFPISFKRWKWIVSPNGVFKVLIHMPKYSNVYPAAHGHLDFGSFLLYDNSGPVLVDRGRYSYNSTIMGEYAFSPGAHNTTLINGLPLLPDCRGIFRVYRKCLENGTKVIFEDMGSEKKVSWQTDVLNRFGKSMKWARVILLSYEGMSIGETLSNASRTKLTIESYLHWAPGWEMHPDTSSSNSDTRFLIMKNGRSYRLKIEYSDANCTVDWINGKPGSPIGWHFPDYGTQVPALTLRLVLHCSGDYALKFAVCPI